MKKNIIMLLAAALFVVTGCKKDDNKTDNGEKMTFTSYLGNGGAKTEIDGKDMKWTAGDEIVINGETFTSEISEGGTFATFTGKVVVPTFNAYYPASLYKENNYVLPATQIYAGDNLSGVNPMYACSENTTLVFHNICALVKLDLKGTCSVASIEAKADQPLSGAFSIEGNKTDGYYAKLTSKDPAATVILNCGNLGVQLNETTPTTFYIALPKGNYTNLTFTVTGINGNTADVKQEGIAMLEAGSLWNKEAKVSYTFTVGMDDDKPRTVEFAPGNLWYGVADGESTPAFHFENNQWDYALGNSHTYYYDWNSNHVSHFFWSKTASVAYADSFSYDGASVNDVFFTNAPNTTANPNFTVNGETGKWRTLSKAEWDYLLARSDGSLKALVTLTDVSVYGLVILPDGTDESVMGRITSTADLATYGAVFLPAAGYRNGTGVYAAGLNGYYWSGTPHEGHTGFAHRMIFSSGNVSVSDDYRNGGYSVRLVR